MLDENSIKERLEILNSDIAKVQENLVTLEKQTKDGIAMKHMDAVEICLNTFGTYIVTINTQM